MVKSQRFRRRTGKVLLVVLVTLVLYNEYISYSLQKWLWWPHLNCEGAAKCMRILLVADPQLLGEQYESRFPKGSLTRWDSDRYLSRTFHRAVDHFRPDVIMFLGDLMDEGSIATDEEYNRYLYRFHSIFRVDPRIKLIFVPGDNDVGGEDQPLTLDKLKRFQESFPQTDVIQLEFADLLKVNRLAYAVPKPEQHGVSLMGNRTRIVVTHLPLLFLPSTFVQQVSTQLRPHLIFSAHDHKSLHIAADMSTGEERILEVLHPPARRSTVFHFPLGRDLLHEIMVPTCSYRMGVYDMGYGAAVIDVEKQVLNYTVLWLPSRFTQLLVYAGVGSVLAVMIYMVWLRQLCGRNCHGRARRTSLGV